MKTPLLRPRRRTTMRSATARTSSMLWLIMMTPRPRSRTRSIRFSTSAVCATPSAAVGSSSMMILGSSSSERAIATVWRWPPDSEAIGLAHARDAGREFVQQRPGADLHRHLVELPGLQLLAEEEVGDDVEVLAEREILEDGGDAERERVGRAGQRHRLAAEVDRAGGRLVHAGEHLDQRRLAGAVVADQGDDLAGMDVEIDVGQRRDGAEILGDAAQAAGSAAPGRRPVLRRCCRVGHGRSRSARLGGTRPAGGTGRADAIAGHWMPSFLQPSA